MDAVRNGKTIIELVIVLGIGSLIIALGLPAVQKVRGQYALYQCINNKRQIGLALSGYANEQSGRLPNFTGDNNDSSTHPPTFLALAVYLGLGSHDSESESAKSIDDLFVRAYTCYGVPGNSRSLGNWQSANVAANGQVFCRMADPNIRVFFQDGTSTTITVLERYSPLCAETSFNYHTRYNSIRNGSEYLTDHRATFADSGPGTEQLQRVKIVNGDWFLLPEEDPGDAYPIFETMGGQKRTIGSVTGLPFQVSPAIHLCDPRVAQTAHATGMPTLFADGSVRTLSARIDPSTFWSLVTPNGGESVNLD